MSKHAPGNIPKGTKFGICAECGYRISEEDKDDMVLIDWPDFVHGRCESEYDEQADSLGSDE